MLLTWVDGYGPCLPIECPAQLQVFDHQLAMQPTALMAELPYATAANPIIIVVKANYSSVSASASAALPSAAAATRSAMLFK